MLFASSVQGPVSQTSATTEYFWAAASFTPSSHLSTWVWTEEGNYLWDSTNTCDNRQPGTQAPHAWQTNVSVLLLCLFICFPDSLSLLCSCKWAGIFPCEAELHSRYDHSVPLRLEILSLCLWTEPGVAFLHKKKARCRQGSFPKDPGGNSYCCRHCSWFLNKLSMLFGGHPCWYLVYAFWCQ